MVTLAECCKKVQSVGDWLEEVRMPQYENILIANGFDDMDFMVRKRKGTQLSFL